MGAEASTWGATDYVALGGNDCAGKTLLLNSALVAMTAAPASHRPVRTISTVGTTHENLKPCATRPHLEVLDVGGGCRSGLLFVKAATSADGVVFVLRATDARLYSALWELYVLGTSS